ncbi:MAG: response regulator transcription factor [Cyclobacteriaceae bacterium]
MDISYKLMIVDDHDMVRQGLESIINTRDDLEILVTTDRGAKALKILGELEIKPDLILLDIFMPEMNGMVTAVKIKELYPEVKILMLSMEISSEYIKTAFQNNIEGYIPKNADIEVLLAAITKVCQGETYYDEKVKDYIFKYYVGDEETSVPKIQNLSEREVQVLKLIANGITNKEIGEKLFISPKTAEAHRNNILKKLNLKSTADLVKFSIAKNITEIPRDMFGED